MKVTNSEAHAWRMAHREAATAQLQGFLEKVGRRGSKKSVGNALNGMMVFCSFLKLEPEEIATYVKGKRKGDVYSVLDEFVGWLVKDCKVAPNSLKDYLSIAKKFLRQNGLQISNENLRAQVDLPRMFAKTNDRAPTQDELRRLLLHTNSRGKAMISMLASSGMRVGELLSLRVKDTDFSALPVTVNLRAEVTKDRQARYCFISDEATTFLREFLGDRIATPSEYLFPTSTRGQDHATGNVPMSYWNADKILTVALRAADLEQKDDSGRDILHIHSLRKFFFSQLVPVLGREVVEALMGHKEFLDSSYRRFTQKQMGEFYLKGMNAVTIMMRKEERKDMKEAFKREILIQIAGYDAEKVERMDLSGISNEEFQKMIREKLLGAMVNNGNKQRVIPARDLKTFIGKGWEYVAQLPDSEVVVRLP